MQIMQEQISVHALVGAKVIESFKEKSLIIFAPGADAPTKHFTKDAE